MKYWHADVQLYNYVKHGYTGLYIHMQKVFIKILSCVIILIITILCQNSVWKTFKTDFGAVGKVQILMHFGILEQM